MKFLVTAKERLQPRYDALVVGSGYGGGVAASRLSRMGFRVAVLEKGRVWRPGDFDNSGSGLLDRTRVSGRRIRFGQPDALFDFRIGREMHVLAGCGLGGGSLVNAGLALRPDASAFARDGWPEQIAEDHELWFDFAEAERMLGVSVCPDIEDLPRYKRLQECAGLLQAEAEPAASTICFAPGENLAGVVQPACIQCGDCWSGCNMGAKNTVALNYLADAHAHGADVFINMDVESLEKNDRGWRVNYRDLDEQTGAAGRLEGIEADQVVLAGGVFGSTEILMRSRARGLSFSPRLGKGFSANGDELAFGNDMPGLVNGVSDGYPRSGATHPVGPNCVGYIRMAGDEEAGAEEGALCIQSGVMLGLMAKVAPLKNLMRGRLFRAISILKNGSHQGILAHNQTFYIVGHDSARGELRLVNGRLLPHWPELEAEPVFGRIRRVLSDMLQQLGAEYMQSPLRDAVLGGRPITVHPLGGCPMGADASGGVVDHAGRVFDAAADASEVYQGLYVMDGSTIPGSLAANPLLTITALAERNMRLLAAREGRKLDRTARKPLTGVDAFM